MGDNITMKRNDTSPSYIMEILTPGVSLSGATVSLLMRNASDTNLKFPKRDISNYVLKPNWDSEGGPEVLIDFLTGDTDENGVHKFEVEVVYADSSIETFPNSDYHILTIVEDLG